MSSETAPLPSPMPRSFVEVFRTEWRWWLPGALLSFVLASMVMTGWPQGLRPQLSTPYIYAGDGLSHSWMTLRVMEGWLFDNARSGYPFGSNFLDYPGSDTGNLLVLKLLGTLSGEYPSALNLYFLLGFAAVFIASFCALGAFGLLPVLSFSASLLFAMLPFHFIRLGHLFYTWYFVAPVFFYLAYAMSHTREARPTWTLSAKRTIMLLLLGVCIASFGVYYALFGLIMLSVVALVLCINTGGLGAIKAPVVAIAFVTLGVVLNIAPNVAHERSQGKNLEVAHRVPAEAEVYGLKLMQLVLPRPGHRQPKLAAWTQHYNKQYPLINENTTSSLGAVGSTGFIILLCVLLTRMAGGTVDARLSFLAMIVLVLFLFGTIGGLGALFSAVVSASIRGWNRISVFIAFGAIAASFLALQLLAVRKLKPGMAHATLAACALLLAGVGLYDQTAPTCQPCNAKVQSDFEEDRRFIGAIEGALPQGSAVYQLPYMPFPEVPPLHRLQAYDLTIGFLHSKALHWSYAGMKGRQGDLFYRSLTREPIETQLDVIAHMGFAGIYLDRRGFEDNGDAVIAELSAQLGSGPLLQRADGQIVFFRLPSAPGSSLSGLTDLQIMEKAGYVVDQTGARVK